MTVGVLALQGAFRAHVENLARIGVPAVEVRTVAQLAEVDSLVMPGGESTTMSLLLESSGLYDAIAERLAEDMPVFGTCAGLILLATTIEDGRPDQRSFGRLDVTVKRNGYGRQVDSFEVDLELAGSDDAFHAVFIRAPRITRVGAGVEELMRGPDGEPVLIRQGNALAAAFHPELSGDLRLHRLFVERVAY